MPSAPSLPGPSLSRGAGAGIAGSGCDGDGAGEGARGRDVEAGSGSGRSVGSGAELMGTIVSSRWLRPAPAEVRGGSTSVAGRGRRSEEHTSELQSRGQLVCRLLLEKKTLQRNRMRPEYRQLYPQ